MLSNIVEHTAVWEGVGGREEIWRGIPQWNIKDGPAAKTTNSNCCDRAAAQVKQHIPEQPGVKNSK